MSVIIKAVYVCYVFLGILFNTSQCLGKEKDGTCPSPQYLEIGKSGIVNCKFHDTFFSVLWFDTPEYLRATPIVHFWNSQRSGSGYISGEYDVHQNGSLIIKEVSLEHDHKFKVAYMHSEEDEPTLIDIDVVIVVKPLVPFPVFDICGNSTNSCYSIVENSDSVQCFVRGARPKISLTLIRRTVSGDITLSNDSVAISEGEKFTSRIISRNVFQSSPLITLLVCKATSPTEMLDSNESLFLAQDGQFILPTEKSHIYAERYKTVELSCSEKSIGFIVWKKALSLTKGTYGLLLYSTFIGQPIKESFVKDITVGENGSLKVHSVDLEDEGTYVCMFGGGKSNGATFHEVTVFVKPVPPYPVISNCDHQEHCVFEAEYEGNLTCKLTGIRPLVHLAWKTFYESDDASISFTNQEVIAEQDGGIYDITVTSTYSARKYLPKRITLECGVVGGDSNLFNLKTKADLFFAEEFTPTNARESSFNGEIWFYLVSAMFLLLVLYLGAVVFRNTYVKAKKVHSKPAAEGEEEIMLERGDDGLQRLSGLTETFLKEIKEKYKDLYDAVQPIPYIKDRLYCVDKVFVEGGIEFLEATESSVKHRLWKSLETYDNIFTDQRVKSVRCILEGEPGYGKSTVTLQFAYDWCNGKLSSALKDVEILILLKLRQLGGVPSIYKAIKRFILPRNTNLSEQDISFILNNNKSVVLILDGFDEYPDRDCITITDVMAIIGRQMFQDFEVVTTTRSSFLPKKFPPLTKRVKLTGFDDKARRYYIRKAVVGDDDDRIHKIEKHIEENPILSDLCQVPLLFVIFAHMTYESKQFRELTSVTNFFRYMISCFHSHMKNKMQDENVIKYELFESDHVKLDKMAFEGLSGDSQRIMWRKNELCEQIGNEFYVQYQRIGILVEEEATDIIDDPAIPITEHGQCQTEVRFYHKLFCEWYAAHYLADYIQKNPDLDLCEYLRHLDPFDVQYLYRFSCGLNNIAAESIINYLKNIEGGDKFAILCILEKTGKIDKITDAIRDLCFEGVVISGHDNLLLQRSSLQLLDIAANNKIPIGGVWLFNCLQSVDPSAGTITTTSGLTLSSKIPFGVLAINLTNREMTEEEAVSILQFATMCPLLRDFWFDGSVPPRSFKVGPLLSNLKERNISVFCVGVLPKSPSFVLNLTTGLWEMENVGVECTDEDFANMEAEWDKVKDSTEATLKKNVKRVRRRLRRSAEERTRPKNE